MKPKPDLDPDFAAGSRRPTAWVRVLAMVVLAAILAGLARFALTPDPAPPAFTQGAIPVLSGAQTLLAQPAEAAPGTTVAAKSDDRFVLMADANMDPRMVFPAPEGMDDAMVHRSAGGWVASGEPAQPRAGDPTFPGYEIVPPQELTPDGQVAPQDSPPVPGRAQPR